MQTSIPKHKITRAASLLKAGARIGGNYAKYYGKKTLTGIDDKEALHQSNAQDSYKTLSELKGGPLKVAQMLSIDKNLLPTAYADVYAQAQYSAPPLSYPLVVRTFQREFGKSPTALFDQFEQVARNGASIGQVHKAEKDGHPYAVKIQYPGVADSLASDLKLVKPIALRMFDLKSSEVEPYFREVEERLMEETDYSLELQRSVDLSAKLAHLPHLAFPTYYPAFSTKKILTMDWMEGIPLDQFADGEAAKERRDLISQALWDFYDYQVHELKIFHADPHPGNFLVHDAKLVVLDFGCVKEVTDEFRQKFFRLLDERCLRDEGFLKQSLVELELILPHDTEADIRLLLDNYRQSTELLARPFKAESFDFGDASYLREIYDFGEKSSQNKELRRLNRARGSAHALYLTRAYFGLYNLMARLGGTVTAKLPNYLQ